MTLISPSGERGYAPTPTEKNRAAKPQPLDEAARRAQPERLPEVLQQEGKATGRDDAFNHKGALLDRMV